MQGSVLLSVPAGGLGVYSRGREGTTVMKPPSNPTRRAGGRVPGMWVLGVGGACLLRFPLRPSPSHLSCLALPEPYVFTGRWDPSR